MKRIHVFYLAELITKEKTNDFEDMLLRAVYWLSSAQTQTENTNKLLNLVTSLETIFKVEKDKPITATLSEGVAMLTADTLDERRTRLKRVAEFYRKRSQLTHEGDSKITNEDIINLTLIVRNTILKILRHHDRFFSHQGFATWLEDQKLSAKIEFPMSPHPS